VVTQLYKFIKLQNTSQLPPHNELCIITKIFLKEILCSRSLERNSNLLFFKSKLPSYGTLEELSPGELYISFKSYGTPRHSSSPQMQMRFTDVIIIRKNKCIFVKISLTLEKQ
jgi:hypothetical protein